MLDWILELFGLGRLSAYADFMDGAYQAGRISGEIEGYNRGYLEGNNAGYDSGQEYGRTQANNALFSDGYDLGSKVGKIIAQRAAALEKVKEQERLDAANARLAEAAAADASEPIESTVCMTETRCPCHPGEPKRFFFLKKSPNDA